MNENTETRPEESTWHRLPRTLVGERLSGVVAAARPLRRRRWADTAFARCDLTGRDLRGSEFVRCSFEDCLFSGSRLAGSTIEGSVFTRCDLRDTDWRECVFRHVVLEDCETDRAAFALSVFDDFRLSGTPLKASQTGRAFGSAGLSQGGAPGNPRWKRGLGSASAVLLIAAAFAVAGIVAYRMADRPSQWSRETVVQKIEEARREGKLDRALRMADQGMQTFGADPSFVRSCLNRKADILLAQLDRNADSEEAWAAVETLLAEKDLEPRFQLDFTVRKASRLLSSQHADQALEVLLQAGRTPPVSVETCAGTLRMAALFEQLGKPGEAEPLLRDLAGSTELVEVQRRDAQLRLARLLAARDRVPEAEAIYQEVLARGSDPGQISHALESLAILAARRADYGRAAATYREIPKRLPGLAWAEEMSLWGLADLYEQTGKPGDALRCLEKILAVSRDPSRVSWSLLKTFQLAGRLNDSDGARTAYQRLQKEFPDTEPAALARQQQAAQEKDPSVE